MDADRQALLAAGADHVETTLLDTERTLTRVAALILGRPAPESPQTRAAEGMPLDGPADLHRVRHAHEVHPAR